MLARPWPAALCLGLLLRICGPAAAETLAGFKSDGCSLFPDKNYFGCCYLHDFAYWPGGAKEEKDAADKALRACVIEATGKPALGELMYRGVQAAGGPELPTPYRWGYGWPWPYRLRYAPLTADEQAQAAEKTARLCKTFKPNPATGNVLVGDEREITVNQARQICPGHFSADHFLFGDMRAARAATR